MVFGDPHYKTFDGKIYSFQGVGKYQLASDCQGHTFSVRVANTFQNRNVKSSTLTKRVAIKVGETRINLGQQFRTKINGDLIRLPIKQEGKFTIEKTAENVLVTLYNGVKVSWSGKSFVEVIVPAVFKNKLCGLCGNFNSNVQDDFRMRKGEVVKDSEVLKFGNSWCVGAKSKCAKHARQTSKVQPCTFNIHRVSKSPCKYLTSTELFNGCDSKLNYSKYYKACMMDMCNCPGGKCYCESLTAYAHECQRLGVNMTNWQKNICTPNKASRRQKTHKLKYSNDYIERLLKQRANRPLGERPPILIE